MTSPAFRRASACLAAAAIALAAVFAATPASASVDLEHDVPPAVPTSGPQFEAVAAGLRALDGLVSVGGTRQGSFVVTKRVDASESTSEAVATFAAGHSNVIVETGEPLEAFASTDVVGGAGYLFPLFAGPGTCSVGFTAWTPSGGPAVITAGHCAAEATAADTTLSRPSTEPAIGGPGFEPLAALGDFGFHQYGGPGDTPGSDGDPNSVDLAVINVTNPALSVQPVVTDWTTAASDDLAASSIPVTSVGEPSPGVPLSKSGRTTGFTTGGTLGVEGWANIGGHWVRGFAANGLEAAGGDSGGAVVQGGRAVGIVSGGVPGSYTWVADIANTLTTVSGGYTLRLALTAPQVAVAAGTDVTRGSTVRGTAPAGTVVSVTGDGGFTATATAAEDGSWSFVAPMTTGDFAFTATATSGFNVSPPLSTTVRLVASPLTAPVVTAPLAGNQDAPVTTITGTGIPGYTVTVTGSVTATTTVTADGLWNVPVNLGAGQHIIAVTQGFAGEVSAATMVAFQIAGTQVDGTTTLDPTTGQPTATDQLAATGADPVPLTVAMLALLVAGAALRRLRTTRYSR